jgi:plastocyanin
VIAAAPPPAPVDRAATVTEVVANGFDFSPEEARIQPGDTVVWRNTGGLHNVVFDDGSYRSGDPMNLPGPLGLRTFVAPGAHAYYCEVHGSAGGVGMAGRIIVGDAAPDVSLTGVKLKRRIRRGRLRGTAEVSPAGTTLTVRVRFRHATAGEVVATSGDASVPFAVPLSEALRRRQNPRVDVVLEAGDETVRRTLRLRR